MQKVYMSSGPIQATKVFLYASLLGFCIGTFIVLIGLLVVVGGGATLTIEEVWPYIMTNIPPAFKDMICVSLLAMAMSTADSCLNACSIILSHDIVASIQKRSKTTDVRQLKIARWTTLIVGLLSMLLTFYYKDLLHLLMLSCAFRLPIISAPSLLAIFGFRDTARTALTGMANRCVIHFSLE